MSLRRTGQDVSLREQRRQPLVRLCLSTAVGRMWVDSAPVLICDTPLSQSTGRSAPELVATGVFVSIRVRYLFGVAWAT